MIRKIKNDFRVSIILTILNCLPFTEVHISSSGTSFNIDIQFFKVRNKYFEVTNFADMFPTRFSVNLTTVCIHHVYFTVHYSYCTGKHLQIAHFTSLTHLIIYPWYLQKFHCKGTCYLMQFYYAIFFPFMNTLLKLFPTSFFFF